MTAGRDKAMDKRQRILDAALEVFAERGFYNAKVAEVAKQVGVADGTIYLYFENKDDLLISLFEDRMEFLIRRLSEALAEEKGDAPAKIRLMIHLHLLLAEEAPALAEFITVELRQSAKFVKEYDNPRFMQYLGILRDLIVLGQSEGTITPHVDARTVSRAIFGALDELLLSLTLASKRKKMNLKQAGDDLADLFLVGISRSSAGILPTEADATHAPEVGSQEER
jgi:TetR/AcrR family fatty acid metabolism transcriptional regulator